MHARQQIQDAVVAALQLGLTDTVVAGRIWMVQEFELPLVGVYTNSETDTLDDGGTMGDPGAIYRTLELACEIRVQGVDGVTANNALNDIAAEVETVMGTQRQAVGVLDILPVTWEVTMDTGGETVTGTGLMGFEVLYRTAVGLPETII